MQIFRPWSGVKERRDPGSVPRPAAQMPPVVFCPGRVDNAQALRV